MVISNFQHYFHWTNIYFFVALCRLYFCSITSLSTRQSSFSGQFILSLQLHFSSATFTFAVTLPINKFLSFCHFILLKILCNMEYNMGKCLFNNAKKILPVFVFKYCHIWGISTYNLNSPRGNADYYLRVVWDTVYIEQPTVRFHIRGDVFLKKSMNH